MTPPGKLLASRTTHNENGRWFSWWVYEAAYPPLDDDYYLDQSGARAYHGGPGQPYANKGEVLRAGVWVFVTQDGGRDV